MSLSIFRFFVATRHHYGTALAIPMPSRKRTLPLNMNSAHSVAQFLYKTGAVLINNGVAYAHDEPAAPDMRMRQTLLDEYNSLPAYHALNNVTVAENPFHALFVMRVGLDHIPAHTIYAIYINLKVRYHRARLDGISIEFPNGSDMLGAMATLQIMRAYILYHSARFNFLTTPERQQVADSSNVFNDAPYSYIIGSETDAHLSRSKAWDLTDKILKRHIPKRTLALACR